MGDDKPRSKENDSCRATHAEHCVALVDYDAIAEDNISFKKNDLIQVTSKTGPSGFWEGFVVDPTEVPRVAQAKSGWFPMCFTTSHPHAIMSWFGDANCPEYYENRAICLDTCIVVSGGAETVCGRGTTVVLLKQAAAVGHWSARALDSTGALCGAEMVCPLANFSCNIVIAAHEVRADRPGGGPLQCTAGETILVHRRWNDGWWEGSILHRDGPAHDRRGMFPSGLTIPNISTTTPPIFCNECKTIFTPALPMGHCVRCATNTEVVGHLLRALEDHQRGDAGKLDLFKYLLVRPREATEGSYESSTRIIV